MPRGRRAARRCLAASWGNRRQTGAADGKNYESRLVRLTPDTHAERKLTLAGRRELFDTFFAPAGLFTLGEWRLWLGSLVAGSLLVGILIYAISEVARKRNPAPAVGAGAGGGGSGSS